MLAVETQYEDVESWELSDSLWQRIEPLLPRPKVRWRGRGTRRRRVGGRPPAGRRRTLAGILYVLRTGGQWNAAPRPLYGSGKTLHRYFQAWTRRGVFRKMWRQGLLEYDRTKGIQWQWQAVDGAMTKAPLGGEATGPNPTDRAKSGTKRSVVVDGGGVPLGLVVEGAHRHDAPLLEPTLDAILIRRPVPTPEQPQHLCLDNGYKGAPPEQAATQRGYVLHRPDPAQGPKRKRQPGRRKARRWVVEVAHSWLNRFRRLLVRWEKKLANYLSLIYFACAIICWRKCEV